MFNCILEAAKMNMYLAFKAQGEKKGPRIPGCPGVPRALQPSLGKEVGSGLGIQT